MTDELLFIGNISQSKLTIPIHNKKPPKLLLAVVQINGEIATAMLDMGSNADIMSAEFARACKLKPFKLAEPVTSSH
jgi:hypothetical protein